MLLGAIPLAGLTAAFMSYAWRKYLGQIGVRPVDLAVDPTSRFVDAVVALSTVAEQNTQHTVARWINTLPSIS